MPMEEATAALGARGGPFSGGLGRCLVTGRIVSLDPFSCCPTPSPLVHDSGESLRWPRDRPRGRASVPLGARRRRLRQGGRRAPRRPGRPGAPGAHGHRPRRLRRGHRRLRRAAPRPGERRPGDRAACGCPTNVPARTVARNCASGIEAVTSAATSIRPASATCTCRGGRGDERLPADLHEKMTGSSRASRRRRPGRSSVRSRRSARRS